MKCDTCGYAAPLCLVTWNPEKENNLEVYCSETCMHDLYSEQQIEWLFDTGLIEWQEQEET